jgi:hypothetical protein
MGQEWTPGQGAQRPKTQKRAEQQGLPGAEQRGSEGKATQTAATETEAAVSPAGGH